MFSVMTNGTDSFETTAPAESPPADQPPPGELTPAAVTPGTAIVGTATIASLFSALWANIVPGPAAGTIAYRWSDERTIQAFYGDGSIMTFTGEARPVAPTVILRS
jgi:hypothetical protein